MEADDLLGRLNERFGAETEPKISAKIAEMHDLITRETAIYLLAKENGLTSDKIWKGSELREGLRSLSVDGKITRIFPTWVTERSASRRFFLQDLADSTEMVVVLWTNPKFLDAIAIGDTVRVRNGYFREGEIHLGRPSITVLEKAKACKLGEVAEGMACNLEGVVKSRDEDYYFVRNGRQGVRNTFTFGDEEREARVVGWGREDTAGLKKGDVVRLEAALMKNGELHLNAASRVVKTDGGMKRGRLESIEFDPKVNAFRLGVGGVELRGAKALVLKALGLREMEGIGIESMLQLKRSDVLGREALYECTGAELTELLVPRQGDDEASERKPVGL